MAFIKNPDYQNKVEVMMNTYWRDLDGLEKHFKKRNTDESEMLYLKIMNQIGGNGKEQGKLSTSDFLPF